MPVHPDHIMRGQGVLEPAREKSGAARNSTGMPGIGSSNYRLHLANVHGLLHPTTDLKSADYHRLTGYIQQSMQERSHEPFVCYGLFGGVDTRGDDQFRSSSGPRAGRVRWHVTLRWSLV